jgi:carbamoyltransferase
VACVLGIHLGHHSSCAVVKDGQLASAIQTERHTRIKYHPIESYSRALPIEHTLAAAGVTLADVDLIVSSLQAAGTASFGLHQPLVEEPFDAFDLFSPRHFVISHHLAHAECASATSGFERAAVLICDYGGSTTSDGRDYALPFSAWYARATSETIARPGVTECVSIYDAEGCSALELLDREFAVPHCQPRTFVGSAASLYDNVTGAVFADQHGHGQLMALAAYAKQPVPPERMVTIDGDHVEFRNDWQHSVASRSSFDDAANLAHGCQQALELVMLAYARRAHRLSGREALTVSGGTFLNILGNTRLLREGPFAQLWVPSAPHDAGISVGCAFWGARYLGDKSPRRRVRTDRLGVDYPRAAMDRALDQSQHFLDAEPMTTAQVAAALASGKIFARLAGRAEFGPRALGGRSLLASPCLASSKARLNAIKGRQWWRPVAPVVAHDRLPEYFDGPNDSPWMTFSHDIRPTFREALSALEHPDGSTRAQSLERDQDPWLYELLLEFGKMKGVAVLVNTSLNGPGQAILETPEDAIHWYLQEGDVDYLLLGEQCHRRRPHARALAGASIRLDDGVVVSYVSKEPDCALLIKGSQSIRLSAALSSVINSLRKSRPLEDLHGVAQECLDELYGLVVRRVLIAEWSGRAFEEHAA